MILDENGKAAVAEERCQGCGAPPKCLEHVNSFGGYWKVICTRCGVILREGRDG